MHRISYAISNAACVFALLICIAVSTSVFAEEGSTQAAAELVENIVESLSSIVDQAADPADQVDAIDEKTVTVALAELKHLVEDSKKLHSMLTSGHSFMQTIPIYKSIYYRRKNIRFFADTLEIPKPIREEANTVTTLFNKLAKFYE
jgi:hypothetical protein